MIFVGCITSKHVHELTDNGAAAQRDHLLSRAPPRRRQAAAVLQPVCPLSVWPDGMRRYRRIHHASSAPQSLPEAGIVRLVQYAKAQRLSAHDTGLSDQAEDDTAEDWLLRNTRELAGWGWAG